MRLNIRYGFEGELDGSGPKLLLGGGLNGVFGKVFLEPGKAVAVGGLQHRKSADKADIGVVAEDGHAPPDDRGFPPRRPEEERMLGSFKVPLFLGEGVSDSLASAGQLVGNIEAEWTEGDVVFPLKVNRSAIGIENADC